MFKWKIHWLKSILMVFFLLSAVTEKDAHSLNDPSICNDDDPAIKHPQPAEVSADEICDNVLDGLQTIPLADFNTTHLSPLAPYRKTQGYNNDVGHNGLDLGGECSGGFVGKEEIHAAFKSVVILSYRYQSTHGWGTSIMTASRANDFSDEIITSSHHHLDKRFKGKCEQLEVGDWLGMEGKTGNTHGNAHLHHTVRQWKNLQDLTKTIRAKGGIFEVFGAKGYGKQDGKHLHGHLDPEGVLLDTFRDYQDPTASHAWSLPFVLDMRHRGIEFGLYTGNYGAGENVTRREAARWLKIAAQRSNAIPATPTFADVHANDPDLPYIEELTHYPSALPVINIDADIKGGKGGGVGKRHFHPDDNIARAEALKMVILSFYSTEFLELYNNWIWKNTAAAAADLLHQFEDVDASDWFAPFVYFGAQKGLVAIQPQFNPTRNVKREEMAKWVSEGAASIAAALTAPCNTVLCPADFFCDPASAVCHAIPTCVPSETVICEAGGGYDGTGDAGASFTDASTIAPLDSGIDTGPTPVLDSGTTPLDSGTVPLVCTPGAITTCGNCGTKTCDSAGQWPAFCSGEGVCSPLAFQSQTCNVTGTQSRTCDSSCAWGGWDTCSVPPPPADSGAPPICTDTYLESSTPSCYTTPGGPTLCLAVQQVSGSSWKYQVCKSGGSFLNNYKTVLTDDNHTTQLGDTFTGNPGDTCTPWRNFAVGYIAGYGPVNGAGVRVNVLSPASCVSSACTYSTGTVTVRKECL